MGVRPVGVHQPQAGRPRAGVRCLPDERDLPAVRRPLGRVVPVGTAGEPGDRRPIQVQHENTGRHVPRCGEDDLSRQSRIGVGAGDRDIGDIRALHLAFASSNNTELSGARRQRKHGDGIGVTASERGREGDRSVGGDGEIFTRIETEYEPGALEARDRSPDGIADAGTGSELDGDGRVER